MSYARFSEGDVYVFPSSSGIECLGCALIGGWERGRWVADGVTHREQIVSTLIHLAQHESAGHAVPNRAWDQLHAELLTGVIG